MVAQALAVGLAVVVIAAGVFYVAVATGQATVPCPPVVCNTGVSHAGHPGPVNNSQLQFPVQAYNSQQADYLASANVEPYLTSADTVYVGGELGNTGSIGEENGWQVQVSSCYPYFSGCSPLPAGISYVGQNFILEPTVAHGGFNSNFSGISGDYEPQLGAQFTFNWTDTLAYFEQWSSEAHSVDLQFHAYPTGQGLSAFAQKYQWNYAQMATIAGSDFVDAQTQGAASCGNLTGWNSTIQQLDTQFEGASIPLSQLTIQLSLGPGCWDGQTGNGASPQFAWEAIKAAEQMGNARIFLWWSLAEESMLPQVLQDPGR